MNHHFGETRADASNYSFCCFCNDVIKRAKHIQYKHVKPVTQKTQLNFVCVILTVMTTLLHASSRTVLNEASRSLFLNVCLSLSLCTCAYLTACIKFVFVPDYLIPNMFSFKLQLLHLDICHNQTTDDDLSFF